MRQYGMEAKDDSTEDMPQQCRSELDDDLRHTMRSAIARSHSD